MINVKRDFQERCDEINLYFAFLEKLITKNGDIIYLDKTTEKIDPILIKTLKANGFLLLYNLTESTIKNAVGVIFETIVKDKVKYEDTIEHIKKDFIKFIKKRVSTDNFVLLVNNISEDLFSYCLSVKENLTDTQPRYLKELFSGNVHAGTISDLAKRFGFSSKTKPRVTNNGKALETIKDKRNDLAHGVFSFQEVGKDYTETELVKMKDQVIAYLSQILDNIETYINNKDYLHRP
jgi:MAE_28990/MAE_18760-like HEPN